MVTRHNGYHLATGAIHMHTTESDGALQFEEVVKVGQQAGLDFLIFTDHMTLRSRELGKEKFYDKLLAIVGYEHNDPQDHHHYLLIDSPHVYPSNLAARDYVAAGARDNAIGIIAHPDEIRDRLQEFPPYPWKDWSAEGFTGIELWNQMSEWMEKLTHWNKLPMALWPKGAWVGPTDRILAKWDEVNQSRKVFGMFGVDAHAFPRNLGPIKFELFSYELHFNSLRNHLLLDQPLSTDYATARKQLLAALRECRLFSSNHLHGDATGFSFVAVAGNTEVSCGGSIPANPDLTLRITLPKSADIRIMRDGGQFHRETARELELNSVPPGLYRVEVRKGKWGWIFSNHIRVLAKEG